MHTHSLSTSLSSLLQFPLVFPTSFSCPPLLVFFFFSFFLRPYRPPVFTWMLFGPLWDLILIFPLTVSLTSFPMMPSPLWSWNIQVSPDLIALNLTLPAVDHLPVPLDAPHLPCPIILHIHGFERSGLFSWMLHSPLSITASKFILHTHAALPGSPLASHWSKTMVSS